MQRNARRLVHDEIIASNIVQEVLEAENIPNSEMPDTPHIGIKVRDVRKHCIYHIQSKIFDRPLIKV